EGQLSEELKHQRLRELMLTQQEVAFARSRSMKGHTLEVLVDRPAGHDADQWVARSHAQAPDIDSVVLVHAGRLYPGQIVDVKVTGSQGYDLVAELPTKKCRSLHVVTA